VTRFSQVRLAAGSLVGAIASATRATPPSAALRALLDTLIENASTRPEELEMLLEVVLFDTPITDVIAEALPRIVPVVLVGQRANDRDRSAMAATAALSLMQDALSPPHLDALVTAFGALQSADSTTTTAAAAADSESAWQSRRLALPMLQLLAFRHRFLSATVTSSALAIGARALVDHRVEVREAAELLIASVLRGQASSLDVAKLRGQFSTLARSKAADEQHGGVLGLAAMMAAEPYNMPTWLLDVAEALARHASSKSRLCRETAQRAARDFFQTRGRALEELGVTRAATRVPRNCKQQTSDCSE
jgi:hypothetical protein